MEDIKEFIDMRTIKFRGKTTNSEWIYGDLARQQDLIVDSISYCIFPLIAYDSYNNYIVDGKTVGQFTGLYDKDGKEIYEGDIIKYTHEICIEDGPGTYVGAVSFYEGAFCLHEDSDCTVATAIYDSEEYGGICVIGNIHDNPELLTNK